MPHLTLLGLGIEEMCIMSPLHGVTRIVPGACCRTQALSARLGTAVLLPPLARTSTYGLAGAAKIKTPVAHACSRPVNGEESVVTVTQTNLFEIA